MAPQFRLAPIALLVLNRGSGERVIVEILEQRVN